jgi:4-amino-4-deoxy-L-arabinose transferase-like glycosyltransferase
LGAQDSASRRGDNAVLLAIAAAVGILHLLTNSRYGFHRDELQFLSDARHMDWGFVAYPPLTAFVERVGMGLFGLSMVGLRLFSVIAQAAAIVVTGLMARELGGRRLAQVTAALAVALSPLPLFEGTEFQYTSFDYLWWVLCAYFVVRLLGTEDRRWWLAIGGAVGAGLMTKYTIGVLALGILCGFALTQRRYLLRNWMFVCGGGLAVCLALPNLVWQAHHGFVSYQFLRSIHERDIGWGRTRGFVWKQFVVCTNVYVHTALDSGAG